MGSSMGHRSYTDNRCTVGLHAYNINLITWRLEFINRL